MSEAGRELAMFIALVFLLIGIIGAGYSMSRLIAYHRWKKKVERIERES